MNRALLFYGALAVAATMSLYYFVMQGTDLSWYLNWIITTSMVLFCLYGFDKMLEKLGVTRIPNMVLHLMALFGGFIGGFLGRGLFNFTPSSGTNNMFTLVLVGSAVLQFGLVWLYQTYGGQFIN